MILIDLSQVMISNLMVQIGSHRNAKFDENMIRHMILNSIRANRVKFKKDFGEIVICADDRNYWRREIFPYYKASRKKAREKDELDWTTIFNSLHKIRDEIKEYMPYQVIQVETAEADDIIGTIVHHEGKHLDIGERILILSGDKDYIQLHQYANVRQYDPTRDKWVTHPDPNEYLFEHIAKGDSGDGIPNALSQDDVFMTGTRQKPVTKKRLAEFKSLNSLTENIQRQYERNQKLIDLSMIPDRIKSNILEAYKKEPKNDRSQIYKYFIDSRLRNLLDSINEF